MHTLWRVIIVHILWHNSEFSTDGNVPHFTHQRVHSAIIQKRTLHITQQDSHHQVIFGHIIYNIYYHADVITNKYHHIFFTNSQCHNQIIIDTRQNALRNVHSSRSYTSHMCVYSIHIGTYCTHQNTVSARLRVMTSSNFPSFRTTEHRNLAPHILVLIHVGETLPTNTIHTTHHKPHTLTTHHIPTPHTCNTHLQCTLTIHT